MNREKEIDLTHRLLEMYDEEATMADMKEEFEKGNLEIGLSVPRYGVFTIDSLSLGSIMLNFLHKNAINNLEEAKQELIDALTNSEN